MRRPDAPLVGVFTGEVEGDEGASRTTSDATGERGGRENGDGHGGRSSGMSGRECGGVWKRERSI